MVNRYYTCTICGNKFCSYNHCPNCGKLEEDEIKKEIIATVRVMPHNEEDETEEERAMEYEYGDYQEIIDYLEKDTDIIAWKYTGNAVSIEAKNKEAITKFQKLLKTRNPDEDIGIEWDYWLDD